MVRKWIVNVLFICMCVMVWMNTVCAATPELTKDEGGTTVKAHVVAEPSEDPSVPLPGDTENTGKLDEIGETGNKWAKNTKTGDETEYGWWMIILCISGILFYSVKMNKKTKNHL